MVSRKSSMRRTLADFRPAPGGPVSEKELWPERPNSANTENPIVKARPGGLLAFDRKDLHIRSCPSLRACGPTALDVPVTDPPSCFHTPPFLTSDMRKRQPNHLTEIDRMRLSRWESCAADDFRFGNRRRCHRQGSLDAALREGPLVANAVPGYFGYVPSKYVENVYGLPFMRANTTAAFLPSLTEENRAALKWKIEVGGASKAKRMRRHIEIADKARRRTMRHLEHRHSTAVRTWCANMENPTKLHNAWRDYGIVGYKGFKPFWKTDKDFHLEKRELGKPNPPYLPEASYHTILVQPN